MKKTPITGVRALKKLLLTLGFHHSWGSYIHGESLNWRIVIRKNTISCTKEGNNYNYINDFNYSYNDIETVSLYIRKFFTPDKLTDREKIETLSHGDRLRIGSFAEVWNIHNTYLLFVLPVEDGESEYYDDYSHDMVDELMFDIDTKINV